ncbi:MAG: hypothetical protein WCS87_09885 [Methylococcaceae bacterium]
MPAMKKLKLSIAAKISQAWPCSYGGSNAEAWNDRVVVIFCELPHK